MKNRLTIKIGGDSIRVVSDNQDIILYITQEFDLIKNENILFEVQKLSFQLILINIARDHSAFKHVCVFISLLGRSTPIFLQDKANDEVRELTDNIKNLDIDFHCHYLQCKNLDDEFSRNMTREIIELYMRKLAAIDFDLEVASKPQTKVENLFNHVGLSHDLIMRDEFLSGNPYWCYPVDTSSEKLVRSVDIRLYYAKLLAKIANSKSSTFLEVGAGSGFTTHYLSSLGFSVEGSEPSEYRVKGAKLLGKVKGSTATFKVGNLKKLPYDNASFDIVFSCFVLEQCQEILDVAINECVRVARDKCVFFEPSTEFFSTLASMVHIPLEGQPTHLGQFLLSKGFEVSVVRPRFQHLYNSGCIFIIDLSDRNTKYKTSKRFFSLLKS